MRTKLVFNIFAATEDIARQKAMEWYADKPNLTVDEVKASRIGGYSVTISYDDPKKKR